MSEPIRQTECEIPGLAGAILSINAHFNKAIDAAAKPVVVDPEEAERANRSGSVQIRINRFHEGVEYADLPIEYHKGEAWFAEDIGPFRAGQSVDLTWEEDGEIHDELRDGPSD